MDISYDKCAVQTRLSPGRIVIATPTCVLRWNDGVLEQCWQHDDGTTSWRVVPRKDYR